MNENIKRYTTILLVCFLLLYILPKAAVACCSPPCPSPCQMCTGEVCVNDNDGVDCGIADCKKCSGGECVYKSGNDCEETPTCDGCDICVNCKCEDRCEPDYCESCISDSCVVCGGDPCMSCCDGECYDTTTQKCCPGSDPCDPDFICDKEKECCDGDCCDPALCKSCISDSCVLCEGDPDMSCCEGTCFNFYTHMCCGGQVCRQPCCDDSDCKKCVDGDCLPCLSTFSSYEELGECSNVVDGPDWTPQPNGCTAPTGDNPAWYVCGEASSFLNACNAHDTCYQTCGSSRIWGCDEDFSNDLSGVCEPLSGDCGDICDFWADQYAGAVLNWGQSAWESGQVNACACCDC